MDRRAVSLGFAVSGKTKALARDGLIMRVRVRLAYSLPMPFPRLERVDAVRSMIKAATAKARSP